MSNFKSIIYLFLCNLGWLCTCFRNSFDIVYVYRKYLVNISQLPNFKYWITNHLYLFYVIYGDYARDLESF